MIYQIHVDIVRLTLYPFLSLFPINTIITIKSTKTIITLIEYVMSCVGVCTHCYDMILCLIDSNTLLRNELGTTILKRCMIFDGQHFT